VGPGRIAEFCRAAALAPDELYWAGRATLVAREQEIGVYDRVFADYFGGAARTRVHRPRPHPRRESGDGVSITLASRAELLRGKDFQRCSEQELDELAAVIARMRVSLPLRRTRRTVAARAGRPDLRRTLRRSFRSGGEPVERSWRRRRERARRLVLLLDVSGSMADYSRPLLLFAHAALRADPRSEAFCFGTRLTRVTRELRGVGTDAAVRRAAGTVFDWSGGTRIGESLKRFLDEYGHRAVARGAVVVICSDGLEVDEPDLLREQMARLARLAHKVVWLNPLLGRPDYEPLARGMHAALPFVDDFRSGHNLVSLEELASALAPS
jgi:uncharacterized protein with von Willebrand factor type A (vWA) domain